ncbi:MAG TPA: 30S ribosome-binding factor RbfA [Polyangiaceae bacterium]|jgi:ribosome-binding factor A
MRREDEPSGHRHARLQSLILEELRALLRDDVSDPALTDVVVAAVVLSIDYRHARVHYTSADRHRADAALARATPFFRARLGEAIDLKRVPDLRFVFDAA